MTKEISLNRLISALRKSLPEENQNRLTVITGKQGSGKTSIALTIAYATMGKKFDPAKHIAFFNASQFLEVVGKAKPGTVIIFDDAGVGVSAREWASKSNIAVMKVAQVFRPRNLWCIFTTPSISYIDINIRRLFHDHIIAERDLLDFKRRTATGRWYMIEENMFTGELYHRTLEVPIGSQMVRLEEVTFDWVPEKLYKRYGKMRELAERQLHGTSQNIVNGGGLSLTVEQTAKVWGMKSADVWQLVVDGSIPIDPNSRIPKIPLAIVQKGLRLIGAEE